MFLTTIPIWQRLAGGKISFPDWRLFSLILKVPFLGVEDRSSIDQNLRKENPVSRNKAREQSTGDWGKNRREGVRGGGLLPGKKEAPGQGPGGSGDPPMPLDPDDEISFRRFSSFDVRFVSDPSRASQKFHPLYRPIPRNLYLNMA
jgi:hypothetical protein